MRKILLSVFIALAPLTANAQQKTYTYNEMCWYLGQKNHPWIEKANCTITDVRIVDKKYGNEYLDKRTIVAKLNSNGRQIVYTVKSWFGNLGFMTWDSDRQFSYKNQYKIVTSPTNGVIRQAQLPSGYAITEVTKDLWVRQISWD